MADGGNPEGASPSQEAKFRARQTTKSGPTKGDLGFEPLSEKVKNAANPKGSPDLLKVMKKPNTTPGNAGLLEKTEQK